MYIQRTKSSIPDIFLCYHFKLFRSPTSPSKTCTYQIGEWHSYPKRKNKNAEKYNKNRKLLTN